MDTRPTQDVPLRERVCGAFFIFPADLRPRPGVLTSIAGSDVLQISTWRGKVMDVKRCFFLNTAVFPSEPGPVPAGASRNAVMDLLGAGAQREPRTRGSDQFPSNSFSSENIG